MQANQLLSLKDQATEHHSGYLTIAESFNRTKQSKLSWQVDKLHSAKLRLCLLCEKKMELEYCSKHPEKALHERVKLFCVHCWAGNNKQCKELLQVKGPMGMTEVEVSTLMIQFNPKMILQLMSCR